MSVPRGVQVVSDHEGRIHLAGDQFAFHLQAMRLAIPHPERPGEMILFGPEDVSILFHPDFRPGANRGRCPRSAEVSGPPPDGAPALG